MPFNDSDIRWTDKTSNAVHGCAKVSEGCRGCYAERVSLKWGHTEEGWTIENLETNVTIKPHYLEDTLSSPCWCFVDSMSDLFNPAVPPAFTGDVLGWLSTMERSCFQLLTKHGPEWGRDPIPMPRNVMLGVSVESPRRLYRLDWLREREAATRFVSFEPLIERIPAADVDLDGVDWAIIGGESGGVHPEQYAELPPDEKELVMERRPMDPGWAVELVEHCRSANVPVFFKQHSGPQPEGDVEIDLGDGPERVEEFPTVPDGVVPAPRQFLGGAVG